MNRWTSSPNAIQRSAVTSLRSTTSSFLLCTLIVFGLRQNVKFIQGCNRAILDQVANSRAEKTLKIKDAEITSLLTGSLKSFSISNRQSGLLKIHWPVLKNTPYVVADYCRFGKPYKKPTRIWTNVSKPNMRCQCNGVHKVKIANNTGDKSGVYKYLNGDLNAKYSVPQALIHYLFT